MSATLDAGRVAAFFGDAPRVTSHGRAFPIQVEYTGPDERPLEIQVRSGIRRLVDTGLNGDILVFLPGQSEIRRAEEALSAQSEIEAIPLHGELTLEAQMKAILPGSRGKRRVILATNIAETSLTIPDVRAVIDSGLGREARYDQYSLVRRLVTTEVSQARLTQRAGRAGRTAPGRVLRLFAETSVRLRPEADVPEILRASLAETALFLLDLGLFWTDLAWLDPPSEPRWQAARSELAFVGAVDTTGKITPLGKRMARLPVPLRVARMFVETEEFGLARDGALLAALLSERDILLQGPRFGSHSRRESGPSDLLDRMDRVREAEAHRKSESVCRRLEISPFGLANVLLVRDQLLRAIGPSKEVLLTDKERERRLTEALLRAFWDRVAERRGEKTLVTTQGVSADLDQNSIVHDGSLLLALAWDVPSRGEFDGRAAPRRPIVRMAHKVNPHLVLDVVGQEVEAREQYVWNAETNRVDVVSGFYLGVLALEESRARAKPGPLTAPVFAKALESKGPKVVDPDSRLETLRIRLELLLVHCPEAVPQEEREALALQVQDPKALLRAALLAAGQEVTSLDELLESELDGVLYQSFSGAVRQALSDQCPLQVRLPSGLSLRVHYEEGKPPSVASRLQDFFSLKKGPQILKGRVALSLLLLAPNHRPVQVTTDLEGFWERHYPSVRRELMRKYPRHLWPEDGRTASPPTPGRIR
jgi:ATP-dependent helicase HrpB